jgi:hypothetical protein
MDCRANSAFSTLRTYARHSHSFFTHTSRSVLSLQFLDCLIVQHAPIDRSLFRIPLCIFSDMKLRTNHSRPLQRLFLPQTSRSYTNQTSRRGVCIQCRQNFHEKSGIRASPGTILRSKAAPTSLNPSTLRSAFALPATFIAGRRRGLATVQNGPKALSFKWQIQN